MTRVARGDQAGGLVRFVDDARLGLAADEIDHLREDGGGGLVKLGVGVRAARIPIAKRFPAVLCRAKNIALARENKVRLEREGKILQAFLEQADRTAGVNGPERAVPLQLADQLHAVAIKDRVTRVRDERAIEIGAEESDLWRHAEGELRNGFRLRNASITITIRSRERSGR